jgi:site-specific DNA-methyltransferase (adenine-specific)
LKFHSNPADLLLDFFAGSGSFGEASVKNGRDCILVDNNTQAFDCMKKRLSKYNSSFYRKLDYGQLNKNIFTHGQRFCR